MNYHRERLLAFADAIGSRPSALRRDECAEWRINGKRGHIYAVPGGYQLMFMADSARAWTEAKRALSFCRVMQDGDGEGALFLDRLPGSEEGEIIRDKFGIFKKVMFSDERLSVLRKQALRARETIGKKLASAS